jgi:Flp pilus assembly protein TadD
MTSHVSLDARAKYQAGLDLLNRGEYTEALRLLGEALAKEETCERWNDWAAGMFAAGQAIEAEHGFRRALELTPEDRQAAENLGVLLVRQKRIAEAITS